ncbi:hypothetical protein GCM10012280_35590 [Wenjunlia tyrosinilytica]|uniref:HTH luxR-type domain-containing protein n=1 Tax=Wenjunlia tyrosinilytica TaxID=1544741 RepID=A0A917ZSW8_9ACTN|nr:hypothetical protein GCM10012280_35590 [Wenjunlia tyrosinilytica]
MARLRPLLRSSRLLTLVGPGGAGKTRLALELAGTSRGGRQRRVRMVELDSLRDGALLPQFAAAVLGAGERGHRTVMESLQRALSGDESLLILDNCEHVIEPCAELTARLLRLCPSLRILATSRESLRVPGEVLFRVGELGLPARDTAGGVAEILRSDAVRLFMERAKARDPGFELSTDCPENADAVARICRRLDGLPLAIELAARRVGTLPLGDILSGLDNQLTLLTDGSRIGPSRHRELRAATEWSYSLLDSVEQALFRRVSLLVGDFGIEGAAAVGAVEPDTALGLVCSLEAKSLVARVAGHDGEARFRQLSSIRAYGLDRLAAAGELDATRERALDWLTTLTERVSVPVPTEDAVRRLDIEQENLAAAVKCSASRGGDRHLRLALGMARVRLRQEQLTACRELLTGALRTVPKSRYRSEAVALAARTASMQADHEEGLRLAEEAVAAERAGDRPAELADALDSLAVALVCRQDFTGAVSVYRECLDITRGLGRPLATAVSGHRLAWGLLHLGAVAEARRLMAECLPVLRTLADWRHQAAALHTAGALALAADDLDSASQAFEEVLHRAPPDSYHAVYPIEGLAIVAAARGGMDRALRLAAAAAVVRARIDVPPEEQWQRQVDAAVSRARVRLGRSAAQAATAAGRRLEGDRLMAYALGDGDGEPAGAGRDCPLTGREWQVAALVAEGLTNAQVAGRLRLSTSTVAAHLNRIRDKLGLRSRTRIAVWVASHGGPASP